MTDSIGDRLAQVRAMTDLSAAALGELAGLSKSIVSMMEAGERTNPNVNTLLALARVFGIGVAWLIDGTGPKPKKEAVRAAVATYIEQRARGRGAA